MKTLCRIRPLLTALFTAFIACVFASEGHATAGALDSSFDPGASTDYQIRTVSLQADGKLIISGDQFTEFDGVTRHGLARLHSDGSLDTSFDPGARADDVDYPGTGFIRAVLLLPDGKLLVGGQFTLFNGVARSALVRLNPDGSVDTNYDAKLDANNVYGLVFQSDGKVIAVGDIFHAGTFSCYGIVRLNDDGSADTSFNALGMNVSTGGATVSVQPDSKVLVVGNDIDYANTGEVIVRLNADGTTDTGFNADPSLGAGTFRIDSHPPIVQPDGKIIYSQVYTGSGTSLGSGIVRLNADGSRDTRALLI